MTNETAWIVRIDYEACGVANSRKAKLARGRGARSTIKAAGYCSEFMCTTRNEAERAASEIEDSTGVRMRVGEVVTALWPA